MPGERLTGPIAALFIRRDSISQSLPDVDAWDDERNGMDTNDATCPVCGACIADEDDFSPCSYVVCPQCDADLEITDLDPLEFRAVEDD